jgi:Cof subfamily protein (haloacid dehalogenase superfamily)
MNLSAIKAVAIDVDGTLLDSDHRLRDEVKDALCDLDSKEIKIVLATARGPSVLGEVLHRLPLSPLLICFSGGWVGEIDGRSLVPKRTVLDRRHPMSAARSIVSLALELNIEPNVFTLEKWRVRKITREILLESQITKCSPVITSDLLEDGNEPSKILLITGESESSEGLHVIAEAIRSVSNPAFSKSNYLEIVPFGVNKAEALLHLTALLGLKLSEVAAIGDGHNDIEMLSECGLGIAMGNASEPVKSVAQWVTGTNNEAGVAQAIRRLSSEGLI